MSDFQIVERNDRYYVTDACGHSLFTSSVGKDGEKEAKAQVKKFEGVVEKREAASKKADRNNPRR